MDFNVKVHTPQVVEHYQTSDSADYGSILAGGDTLGVIEIKS